MFMADDNNFRDVGDKAPFLYKRYLAMFRTHMNKAISNTGTIVVSQDEEVETVLYASDGREFDNTIVGRKALERHEARING
jgi:hypothetical protein